MISQQMLEVTAELEANYLEIKKEFNSVPADLHKEWPRKSLASGADGVVGQVENIHNGGWNIFGLRFRWRDLEKAQECCPVSSSIIKKHNKIIHSAGFSMLDANTVIKPHVGITNKVLRCHLGITIPNGDCAIKVDNKTFYWQEGKAFIFDDTLTHEAWNKTEYKRVIMLLDLIK